MSVIRLSLAFPLPFRDRTVSGVEFAVTLNMLRDFHAFQLAKEFHWACKSLKVSRYLQDQLLRASAIMRLVDRLGAILFTLTRIPEVRDRTETATETPNSNG
jgi:hypothetical protein